MNDLQTALNEYLRVRRTLGFKLRDEGTVLPQFLRFLKEKDSPFITTNLALQWATQPEKVLPAHWARRLSMVRVFAQFRNAVDPRTEIPPQGLLPYRYRRKPPYIYDDGEISRLIEATSHLRSATELRASTYSTLFGLLAITGMWVSEPIAFDSRDVDLTHGILTVQRTKFRKSRLIPVHPSTVDKLVEYSQLKSRIFDRPKSPSFFVSERGTRLTQWSVRYTFVKLSCEIGLRAPHVSHGPRLHDLRHTFAVKTLLKWYQTGVDVERHMPELATYLGAYTCERHLLVHLSSARTFALGYHALRHNSWRKIIMKTYSNFPALLQAFFTDRLMRQRQVSPETIASYRDAFCLLFKFAQQRLNKIPSALEMEDLDAPLIVAFLCWLEDKRGNGARTRNARLAAIHSFFKYASLCDPTHSGLIQRVLAIPGKRYDRMPVEYLTHSETEALLAAPDQTTWGGRRDKTLLLLTVQTGLRVSELVDLNCQDIVLGKGAHVHCNGKGRKKRCTPLRKEIVKALHVWLHERNGRSSDPLFPNARGKRLSRDGVEYLLRKHANTAAQQCPSLRKKRISPHVLRHTAAMDLLQHGVDRTVIALWLGHETLETVDVYVRANLQMKEKALAKTTPLNVPQGRYRPDDELLAFLKGL